MSRPAIDLSLVATPDDLVQLVAATLAQHCRHRAAAEWRQRAATALHINGLVVLAREYVEIVPWPRPEGGTP